MKRIHLFEFEDFSWFPDYIRDGGTDFLGFILKLTRYYQPIAGILEDALKKTTYKQVVDLCAGNGGPVESINEKIDPELDIRFILTDKYPNIGAYEKLKSKTNGRIDYYPLSWDIMGNNEHIDGFRTMFSAIHHFKPKQVKEILRQVIESKQPVGIFDSGDKHIGTIAGILLFHPILFFFCTPFFKPFKWSRIVFTYLIPLIPLYTVWDGVVSILRLYKPSELLSLAKAVDEENKYDWSCGKAKNSIGFSVTYLTGIPK